MTVYPREYTALSAAQAGSLGVTLLYSCRAPTLCMCTPGSTQPLQGPWPMDRYPCSLDYINYHVNGVGMR
ncbi:BQ5605_C029g10618 [Microbotryum silenes-dioicae]|uniref:BQ5605_C002g01179 protein n=1 Tax=Microbotryum silenes-dioicae TaxID=796604 RepID=A0A2X0MXJ0_9BASI|nr:BQ5605_C014g07618 [Microbotryum silenes-dioicae]SGY30753.1 BQ5605_C002g01179 [Microbotryum silenes-dioicae]SGY37971.1 BQ5605_C003g01930 [Microbotryum silenes-dioicae]SGY74157.1 BQ5605_C005g03344 [Microbotryum silenes-dioicae]SGY77534.1 BQ5605_C005g03661 [Microbotryum silenes-dioicae]